MIDCTTRQCVQIHWITLDDDAGDLRRLERVGLTTTGACGDVTRNVVGCTVAGIAHDEVVDGYATAEALHEHFLDNSSTRTCRASTRSASPAAPRTARAA